MQDKNIFLAARARVAVLFLMCFNFASHGNAQACIDHDGDGWGWDGVGSCQVGNAGSATNTNAPGNDGITRTITTTSNTTIQNNVQSNSVAISSSALRVLPAACEIESGQNFCNVFAEYNASGAGPHCLFETTPDNQQAVLLTCGNPTKVRVPVAANQSKLLELRSGSLEYSNSQLIAQRSIAGISGVQRGSFSLEDTRQPAALRNSSASSLATSWDGRLHFDVMTTGGTRVSVVRVLRSERLYNQPASALSSGNCL